MLSYRHGFHAGNHADVLKHWALVLCIEYLKQKDKPFFYIDTHSGSGRYALLDAYARKTGEAEQGIGILWQQKTLPPVFDDYLNVVRSLNHEKLVYYPGSPMIAERLLRDEDKLRLIEMHSSELQLLHKHFDGDDRIKILEGDGFQHIKALLPPAARRGIVLIDPSYEQKSDYHAVITALNESLKRFSTGLFIVWYPLINSVNAQRYSEQLKKLPCDNWLNIEMRVSCPPQGHGMFGSGLFVINPPWVLKDQLESAMPHLLSLLKQDETADFQITHQA